MQADSFAVKWTLSEEEEKEILAAIPLNEMSVRMFAQKFNTHPAIIVGRLQHKGYIPYTFGRKLFESITLDN